MLHNTSQNADTLFSKPMPANPFSFDESVVRVFDDMIRRSVPGYELILKALGLIARRHVQADSRVYDLGCSLGASTLAMRRNICCSGVEIIAIDNSQPMIERCQTNIDLDPSLTSVQIVHGDILSHPIQDASLVSLNFVLQFVSVDSRPELLQKIFRGLRPGGVLFLSEKIDIPDASTAELVRQLYEDFKRSMGYSDLEIAQKREALENILVPQTAAHHLQSLQSIGFSQVTSWFQWGPFCSFLAQKPSQ